LIRKSDHSLLAGEKGRARQPRPYGEKNPTSNNSVTIGEKRSGDVGQKCSSFLGEGGEKNLVRIFLRKGCRA